MPPLPGSLLCFLQPAGIDPISQLALWLASLERWPLSEPWVPAFTCMWAHPLESGRILRLAYNEQNAVGRTLCLPRLGQKKACSFHLIGDPGGASHPVQRLNSLRPPRLAAGSSHGEKQSPQARSSICSQQPALLNIRPRGAFRRPQPRPPSD